MNHKGISMKQTICFVLLLMASHVHATSVQSIEFSALGQDAFEVELVLSDAEQIETQVYVIEEPARIVLDLPAVTNEVVEREFALSFANASEALLLGTNDRTRLVLNLGTSAEYETRQAGNRIFLRVGTSAAGAPTAPVMAQSQNSGVPVSPIAASNSSRITDFQFGRGEDGEGNIQFEFSGNQISSDVEQSGSNILLRFFGTDMPSQYERIFDVIDFATPVRDITLDQVDNEVQVSISTLAGFDYLAYQADNSFVLSVKPLTAVEEAQRLQESAFSGETFSFNFQSIEVRAVLQLIADLIGLNLVASDTVNGSITLRLENVPWDQALDIILKAKGLDQRMDGNVLLVAPIAEIAERERLEVQASRQLEELAPLRTEFVRIRYADATTIASLLIGETTGATAAAATSDLTSGTTASSLSERGSAIVDARTNTIILTDTDAKIADFLALVEQIDVPIRQVLIEARLVIANTDFRNELGVRWGNAGVRTLEGGASALQFGGSRDIFSDGGPLGFFNNSNDLSLDDALAVDLGVASPAASFGVAFLSDSAWVDLELSALESEGHGEIVSQPKVITGDKQTALIRSGQEVAYQEAAASGATTTAFKEAVLSLQVTPQITPDDRVILDLVISQDSIGDLVFGGEPTIDVTSLETQVLVDNGETLVLGGIFQMTSIDETVRVPVLGSLPFVGQAFRNDVTSQEKREILMFITPKILNDSLSTQ
jgi:type IV pilus assembly protein PilQ